MSRACWGYPHRRGALHDLLCLKPIFATEPTGLGHFHLHQTRHTYARIVAEETGSFIEAQEALDHENQATTRVYVQRITVKRDRHGRKVAGRMKLGRDNSAE